MNLTPIALAAGTLLLVVGAAVAQDRMPPIPNEKMTEAQKKAAQELISGPRGALVGPFIPMLRSPDLMTPLQETGAYLRYHSAFPGNIREMIILMTARQWTQQFEFNSHMPLALKAGVKPETLAAIQDGRRPAELTPDEDVAYQFISELMSNRSVTDQTYARAVKTFGERGTIDMAGLCGYYTTLAMIMNTARTPLPPGTQPPLAPFPH